MIGDWVECVDSTHKKKVYAQIDAIEEGQICILVRLDNCNWFLDISFIKPIPLTREILEKNGFKIEEEYDEIYDTHNYYATLNCVDSKKRNVEVNYSTFSNEITIFCHDRQNILLCCSLETQIKHVHELQHALRLCRIKEEIVL